MRNAHAEKKPLAAGSLAESVLDALPHPVVQRTMEVWCGRQPAHPKLGEKPQHGFAFVEARRTIIDIGQEMEMEIDWWRVEHSLISFDGRFGPEVPPPILSC